MTTPRRPRALGVVTFLLLAFLYLPLVVVVLFAFNGSSNLSWPIHGLSLRWFSEIFSDPNFSGALITSIEASSIVAALSAAFATAAALVFTRRPTRPARLLRAAALLPAMAPPLFIAVALFTAMDLLGITPALPTIVLGQLVITSPFVLVIVTARLERFDVELEAAARDLGAGAAETLGRITLPIVMPAIIGAALLAFAFSFDEVLITNFTSGTTTTLPIYIYSKLHRSIDPSVNAVATLLLVIPWLALAAAAPLLGVGRRRRARTGESA